MKHPRYRPAIKRADDPRTALARLIEYSDGYLTQVAEICGVKMTTICGWVTRWRLWHFVNVIRLRERDARRKRAGPRSYAGYRSTRRNRCEELKKQFRD